MNAFPRTLNWDKEELLCIPCSTPYDNGPDNQKSLQTPEMSSYPLSVTLRVY